MPSRYESTRLHVHFAVSNGHLLLILRHHRMSVHSSFPMEYFCLLILILGNIFFPVGSFTLCPPRCCLSSANVIHRRKRGNLYFLYYYLPKPEINFWLTLIVERTLMRRQPAAESTLLFLWVCFCHLKSTILKEPR